MIDFYNKKKQQTIAQHIKTSTQNSNENSLLSATKRKAPLHKLTIKNIEFLKSIGLKPWIY